MQVLELHGSCLRIFLLPPVCPIPVLFSIPTSPSVAKALCVKTVGAQALKLFQEHPIFSEVISDQEAVAAIEKFVGMFQDLTPWLGD